MKTGEWKGIRGTIKTFPVRKVFPSNELVWCTADLIKEFSKYFDLYFPYKNVIIGIPVLDLPKLKEYFDDKNIYAFLEENKNKEYHNSSDFENDFREFIARKNGFIIPHWVVRKRIISQRLMNFIKKYKNNQKAKNIFNKIFSSSGYFYNGWQYTILEQIDDYITLCGILNIPIETGDFFRNYDNILKIKESREREAKEMIFKKSQAEKKLFFENENFIIIIPTTYKEVQKEGEKLHNCLGGYEWNNYLSQGKRKIVFIRKKDNQNESYIACDIDRYGTIQQFLKQDNNKIDKKKDGENIFDFKEKYQEYLLSIWNKED